MQAGSLSIAGRGVIDATTFGAGNAANITVVVPGAVSIAGRGGSSSLARISSIAARLRTGANAGQVVVQAGSLTIRNMGRIGGDALGTRASGTVQVLADRISLQDGGAIASPTSGSGAAATSR